MCPISATRKIRVSVLKRTKDNSTFPKKQSWIVP
jgi:hypothetical protein